MNRYCYVALVALVALLVTPACLIRDKIAGEGTGPAALKFYGEHTGRDEVAFTDGELVTGWLDASAVRVQGDKICVATTGKLSRHVQRIEIAGLTESDLPNVLAGLSMDIAVEPLGPDRVGFSPLGVDVASWLNAPRVHPIPDRITFQVRLTGKHDGRAGLAWATVKQLLAARPAVGWPIVDIKSSLLRRTNIAGSIAVNTLIVAAIPVILLFAVIAHAPIGGGGNGSRWSGSSSGSAANQAGAEADWKSLRLDDGDDDLPATWAAQPCDGLAAAQPLPR